MVYNRVLAPAPLILRAHNFGDASSLLKNKIYLDDSDIDIKMTREIAIQVTRILINQSAHEIIFTWNNKELEKQVMEEFPIRLKRRTKSIYLTDIPSNFLSLFEPICNEQICSPTLDMLINEFFQLYMACKERTEVDILSTFNILNNWNNVFNTSKYLRTSPDVQDLLAELRGLINIYKYLDNIECFVDVDQEIPIEKRIEDFLSDAYINKLSKEKYYFGIPARAKESIHNFKQLIKNIALGNLKCAIKGSVPLIIANAEIELDVLKEQGKYYSPPVVPLKDIYMSEINNYISKNSLDKLYFIETMPVYRAGFRLYACDGNESNQSLVAEGLKFKGEYCLGGNNWIEINLSNSRIGNLVF